LKEGNRGCYDVYEEDALTTVVVTRYYNNIRIENSAASKCENQFSLS
jgi:hypothetical protein